MPKPASFDAEVYRNRIHEAVDGVKKQYLYWSIKRTDYGLLFWTRLKDPVNPCRAATNASRDRPGSCTC